MRGRYLPTSFLVLAFVAGLWLLLGVFSKAQDPEWQPAGLGSSRQAAASWLSVGWHLAAAAPPAAAQGGLEERSESLSPPPPKFSRIVIRPGFESSFEGTGRPGQRVEIILDGKQVASIKVGADGRWRASTSLLGAGDYRVSVVAREPGQNSVVVGQDVRIAIPQQAATSEIVAYEQSGAEREADLRAKAERLAEAASKKFDDFANTEDVRSRRQENQKTEVAQEPETTKDTGSEVGGDEGGSGLSYDQVEDWFKKSAEDYHRYVVPELARKGERPSAVQIEDAAVPLPEPSSRRKTVAPSGPRVVQRAQDWFRDANRTYQETIVRDLSQEQQTSLASSEAEQEIAPDSVAKDVGALQGAETVQATTDDEPRQADVSQADANRPEQEVEQERLRLEEAERKAEAERQKQLSEILARREAEFAQAQAERRDREAEQERLRLTEAERKAEAERQERLAEEQARRDAELAKAEADRRAREAEQERLRLTEAERKAEAERQKRLAEEQARRDAALAKAEADRRNREAEQERLRLAEAKRKAEAERQKRLAEEQARRDAALAKAEADRREREAKQEQLRLADAKRKAEAERQKRLAEEQARRDAALAKAEADRRDRQAEAERRKRVAEQERRWKEEAERQAEAARQKQLAEKKERQQRELVKAEAARRAREAERERLSKEDARQQADAVRQKRLAKEQAEREEQRLIAEAQERAERDWQAELERQRKARLEEARREAQQRRLAESRTRQRRQNIAKKAERARRIAELADEAASDERSGSQDAREDDVPLAVDLPLERDEQYADQGEADTSVVQRRPVRRGRSAGWRGRRGGTGTGCRDRRAGRSVRLPGTYVVARGDTLWHISRRHYQRGYRYRRIYRANRRKIRDPHWIYPCQKFWLPRPRRRR